MRTFVSTLLLRTHDFPSCGILGNVSRETKKGREDGLFLGTFDAYQLAVESEHAFFQRARLVRYLPWFGGRVSPWFTLNGNVKVNQLAIEH